MEQEIPFKIFPLQRMSSSHVSAVKPQAVVENTSFFQNLKSPYRNENKSYTTSNSDYISLKVPPIGIIEEENPDAINQLYSKLHREAEKIKKWKCNVEYEIKEKETKVQEKRNIIDAQKRIIQELQHENGNLRLEMEDVINENEDLVKQGNATRHMCNIVKETCERAAEKANMYENEIDDTRLFYSDLNNNIERMIMAFEELRVQAENSRQELYNQIKQDNEKKQEMQKEQDLELAKYKKQILELTQDREDNENKILHLNCQLNQSNNRIQELNEVLDNYQIQLEKDKKKADEIIPQLEAAYLALQNTKNALKSSEHELNTTQTLLSEATKEKHLLATELTETRSQHVLQLSVLQSKVVSLEETLSTEQKRLQESENKLEELKLEVINKSTDIEELTKTSENHKKEIELLKTELEESIKVQTELEEKVAEEKSENTILKNKEQDLLISKENLQDQFHGTVKENTTLKKLVGDLKEVQFQLLEKLKSREDEIHTLNIKINMSSMDVDRFSKHIEELKNEVVKNEKENESLKEQLTAKDRECSNEHEDKKKSFENEISKKEKQQKTLENKLSTLKKQVENKNKTIEELQQENKALKKKMKEGCKHCSVLEAEVNKLQSQIDNTRIQHEKVVSCKQLEITDAKAKEETLKHEVEKLKLSSEEASRMQRETDIKCQHKIAEMMALMEKHKHQYDKLLEEKDAELGGFRAKEQEIEATRILMENELSNKNNEIARLKKHLKQEKEQKVAQTVSMVTPKHSTKIGDTQHSSSFLMKTPLKEKGRKLDNNEFPASKNSVPKTFSVKTPKYENVTTLLQDSAKKKRKVAIEFDFHSDSSDPTDILGICGNETMFKSLCHMSNSTPIHTTNQRKRFTESSLKSTAPALKATTVKKKWNSGWTEIAKVERRRKMKAAEEIFS